MSNKDEKAYNYGAIVWKLYDFLVAKRSQLILRRKECKVAEKGKVNEFIELVEDALDSKYFQRKNLYVKVRDLMVKLKADDVMMKAQIDGLNRRIQEIEEFMIESADTYDEAYAIPDEAQDWDLALKYKRAKLEEEMVSIRYEIDEIKQNLKICRNIKGIISRPNGFFEKVLPQK